MTRRVGSDASVSLGGFNCSKVSSLQGGSGRSEGEDEDGEVERLLLESACPQALGQRWSQGMSTQDRCVGSWSWSLGSLVSNEPAPSWTGGQVWDSVSRNLCWLDSVYLHQRVDPRSPMGKCRALLPISQLSSVLFFVLLFFNKNKGLLPFNG